MPTFDPVTGQFILTEEEAMGAPGATPSPNWDPVVSQVTGLGEYNPNFALDPEPVPVPSDPQQQLAGMPTYGAPSAVPGVEEGLARAAQVPEDVAASQAAGDEITMETPVPPGEQTPGFMGTLSDAAGMVRQGLAGELPGQKNYTPLVDPAEGGQLSMPGSAPEAVLPPEATKAKDAEAADVAALKEMEQDPDLAYKRIAQEQELATADATIEKGKQDAIAKISLDAQLAAEESLKKYQDYTDNVMRNMEAKIREVEAMKVNPAQLFDDIGAAGSIGMALSVGIGQMLSMKHGIPNTALQIVNKAIDSNIAAQVKNIENQYNVLQEQKGLITTAGQVEGQTRLARAEATAKAYAFAEATALSKVSALGSERAKLGAMKLVEDLRSKKEKAYAEAMQAAEENNRKNRELVIREKNAEVNRQKQLLEMEAKRLKMNGRGRGGGGGGGVGGVPKQYVNAVMQSMARKKAAMSSLVPGDSPMNYGHVYLPAGILPGRNPDDMSIVWSKNLGGAEIEALENVPKAVRAASSARRLKGFVAQWQDPDFRRVIQSNPEMYNAINSEFDKVMREYAEFVGGYGAIGKDEQENASRITGNLGGDVKILELLAGDADVAKSVNSLLGLEDTLLNAANERLATYDIAPITPDQMRVNPIVGPQDRQRALDQAAGLTKTVSGAGLEAYEAYAAKAGPDAMSRKGFIEADQRRRAQTTSELDPYNKDYGSIDEYGRGLKKAKRGLELWRKQIGEEAFNALGYDQVLSDIEGQIPVANSVALNKVIGKFVTGKGDKGAFKEEMQQEAKGNWRDIVASGALDKITKLSKAHEDTVEIDYAEYVQDPQEYLESRKSQGKAANTGASKAKDFAKGALGMVDFIQNSGKRKKK